MAAAARWACAEYQTTASDEVSVCLLSAAYSSWPLSREAPLDTYGGHLFKFFGRARKKWGALLGFGGVKNQFEGVGMDVFWGFKRLRVEVTSRLAELPMLTELNEDQTISISIVAFFWNSMQVSQDRLKKIT